MGLAMDQKQMQATRTTTKQAQGSQNQGFIQPVPKLLPVSVQTPVSVDPAVADELIIEIVGSGDIASVTLRPHEVSRLRSRFGRGPGFEAWVAARIRDAMVTFGGG